MREGTDRGVIPDNNLAAGIPASVQSLCRQIGFIGFHCAPRFGCHRITLSVPENHTNVTEIQHLKAGRGSSADTSFRRSRDPF
jgi:hypothetical protein